MKKCDAGLLASAFKRQGEINERRKDLFIKQNQMPGTEFDLKEQQYETSKEDIRLALKQRCDGIDLGNLKCSAVQLKSIVRNARELSNRSDELERKYKDGNLTSQERAKEHNKLTSIAEGLIIEGRNQCGVEIYSNSKELLEKGKGIEDF